MLHAWITTTFFWLTDSTETIHHIVHYNTDDELRGEVMDEMREVAKRVGQYNFYPEVGHERRVKIEGPNGFAMFEVEEAFTREQMQKMGYLDEEEIILDPSVWGGIISFKEKVS